MGVFPYIPHTESDIAEMLAAIGVREVAELFTDIPDSIRQKGKLDLPPGISEAELISKMEELAESNDILTCFLGAGCYDHLIPSVVSHLSQRAEFLTSYTPYQAEVSQGMLQALFEFQTLICELTGMAVSNASLYDGHTAAVEACSIALQAGKNRKRIIISGAIHPNTLSVIDTHFAGLELNIEIAPIERGTTDFDLVYEMLDDRVAALFIQTPNYFGCLEDLTGVAEKVHNAGAQLILSCNPISLGILRAPGEWGADIAIGDGQPLGLPMYLGGPSLGFIATTKKLIRRLPGRIVGQTLDTEGRRAFVLTLQAREQHIKRERATSNICTNQSLSALASAIFLSSLGREGFRELAEQNLCKAKYLANRLRQSGAELLFERPYFNEFTIDLHRDAGNVLDALKREGILGGFRLTDIGQSVLLVAVTEKRTRSEMDRYVEIVRGVSVGGSGGVSV